MEQKEQDKYINLAVAREGDRRDCVSERKSSMDIPRLEKLVRHAGRSRLNSAIDWDLLTYPGRHSRASEGDKEKRKKCCGHTLEQLLRVTLLPM